LSTSFRVAVKCHALLRLHPLLESFVESQGLSLTPFVTEFLIRRFSPGGFSLLSLKLNYRHVA